MTGRPRTCCSAWSSGSTTTTRCGCPRTPRPPRYAFSNGGSYTVSTAGGSGEGGRGDTPTLAHMSEAAFYKNPEKNIAGFASSVPMGAIPDHHGSTASGVGNEFHSRWVRAEARLSGAVVRHLHPIFIPWFMSDEYQLPVPETFRLRTEPGRRAAVERDIAEMYDLSLGQMAWRRFYVGTTLTARSRRSCRKFPCTATEAFQRIGAYRSSSPSTSSGRDASVAFRAYGPRILGLTRRGWVATSS